MWQLLHIDQYLGKRLIMPKILYQPWKPGGDALDIIVQANAICTDYGNQGYDLTLRQLYYQFVARGLIPNTQQSYKRLGDIINKARLAGLLDWDSIIDRTRNLISNSHWRSPADIIRSAAQSFAIDKWSDQDMRVEVWVEKEALAGIVSQVAERHDCAWFSCRGYVSQSELWAAARRHLRYLQNGQRVVVVHLGDHDPSGIDMTRDITARLQLFVYQDWLNAQMDFTEDSVLDSDIREHIREHLGSDVCGEFGEHDPIEVRRIALNMDQVEQYDPPPNPTKLTDSRATDYIENYGYECWELDALDPATLDGLIDDAITGEMDPDRFHERQVAEEDHRTVLSAASRRWSEVRTLLNGNGG
jgi:hypothetical protein